MTETLRTAARAAAGCPARAARLWLPVGAVLVATACRPAAAAEDAQDLQGANVSGYVYTHRIPLYDIEDRRIGVDDDPLLPFSTRHTCGKCHDYDTIAGGWHFSAPDPKVAPGRAGQPWLIADPKTGTRLPLSYRPWPGTHSPGDVGITPWRFVQLFGRHMPGGGPGERAASRPADPKARWAVSGRLEINCLACHSADRGDDMNEWYVQIAAGNLMWAPAGMSSLATVRGSAEKMPLTYDPFLEPDSDDRPSAPRVYYDRARFDPTGKVFFDVVRRPEPARCLFCHTNAAVGPDAPAKCKTVDAVSLCSCRSFQKHHAGPEVP